MKITALQNRRLHKLLSETQLTAWKVDYVVKYSFGRTAHSSELSTEEAQGVINALERVKNGKELPINNPNYGMPVFHTPPTQTTDFEKADRLRKAIISKFITMGAVTDTGKSDIPFINQVLERKWKKKLNDLSIPELRKLIAVIEKNLLPWYYKKKAENPNFTIKGA